MMLTISHIGGVISDTLLYQTMCYFRALRRRSKADYVFYIKWNLMFDNVVGLIVSKCVRDKDLGSVEISRIISELHLN